MALEDAPHPGRQIPGQLVEHRRRGLAPDPVGVTNGIVSCTNAYCFRPENAS